MLLLDIQQKLENIKLIMQKITLISEYRDNGKHFKLSFLL